jgi:hypothetical protein
MTLLYFLSGAAVTATIAVMMVLMYRYAFQKGWDTRDAIVTGKKEYFERPEDYKEPPEFALLDKQEKKPEIDDDENEE